MVQTRINSFDEQGTEKEEGFFRTSLEQTGDHPIPARVHFIEGSTPRVFYGADVPLGVSRDYLPPEEAYLQSEED